MAKQKLLERELLIEWKRMLDGNDSDNSEEVFLNVVTRSLNVCNKQFIKTTKDKLKLEKNMAHQKKVLSKNNLLTMQMILNDSSQNRIVSHLKLKIMALEERQSLHRITKVELVQYCSFYNTRASLNYSKEELINRL